MKALPDISGLGNDAPKYRSKILNPIKANRFQTIVFDLYYLSLALFILTMAFPIRANNLAMLFTVACWLVLFFSNNQWRRYIKIITNNTTATLMILFSLFFIVSSIVHHSSYDNLDIVLKNIEKRIHILAFPVILSGMVFLSKRRLRSLLMLFV